MDALAWIIVAAQVLATTACAVHLARRHRHDAAGLPRIIHRTALVLLAVCVLPVPVLVAAHASAAAWGLWGATYIAATLVYASADTARDTPGTGRVEEGGHR
jgi:hypothetical protein